MGAPRAVFLDRDGVLNAAVADPESGLPESPLAVDDVSILEGVGAALRRLVAEGFLLIGASNQPAAAKGKVHLAQLEAVQARVMELLAEDGVRFDDFRICLHHPAGVNPALGIVCDCRKPAPGMLLAAARERGIDLARSWMVGDTDADTAAGIAAGARTVLVRYPGSAHKRAGRTASTAVAEDLPGAVRVILDCADS